VSVSLSLLCTPSVSWLCWLFSFLSAHHGRLSFIISKLYIRSLLTVHRLRRVSRSRFVVCYIAVPSVLCLCRPLVTSIIDRPPHHLCGSAGPLSFTASIAVVSVGASSFEVTSPPMSVCSSSVPSLCSSFFLGGTSTRGIRLCLSRSIPLLHQVWLMPSGFRLSISALCVCRSRTLSYIPSVAPPPHKVLFYPLRCFRYL